MKTKKIKKALISVFHKDGLAEIAQKLHNLNIQIYSTAGTQKFIEKLNIPVCAIEDLTDYPAILGGRVKTLHPKVFGGILARRNKTEDKQELAKYQIPQIDLVMVDLYPFRETRRQTKDEKEIIKKIDIGGISLIRAGAKNYQDVLVVASQDQYTELMDLLVEQEGQTDLETRKRFAQFAFQTTSQYDAEISKYFSQNLEKLASQVFGAQELSSLAQVQKKKHLRYGENPHQRGVFYGDFEAIFEQLHGKEISYNNLLDIEAGVNLIDDFSETTFAILKHNNACGVASDSNLKKVWQRALAGDPVSAFGGVLLTNQIIDAQTAVEIDKIFFEIIIAPAYKTEALKILQKKKNRIILKRKQQSRKKLEIRTLLNGVIVQESDCARETKRDLEKVTSGRLSKRVVEDLLFANKIVKHSKSNAIVLARDKQLLASGVGQTSRVDALKNAIIKAKNFKFDLEGAVMASDAFFPFVDCLEIAAKEGIKTVIQPGGSVRDREVIDFCNQNKIVMVFTGQRHFKH